VKVRKKSKRNLSDLNLREREMSNKRKTCKQSSKKILLMLKVKRSKSSTNQTRQERKQLTMILKSLKSSAIATMKKDKKTNTKMNQLKQPKSKNQKSKIKMKPLPILESRKVLKSRTHLKKIRNPTIMRGGMLKLKAVLINTSMPILKSSHRLENVEMHSMQN